MSSHAQIIKSKQRVYEFSQLLQLLLDHGFSTLDQKKAFLHVRLIRQHLVEKTQRVLGHKGFNIWD